MKRVILKERRLPPAPKLWHARPQPLLLHLYPDQTSRAVARHESAGPTVAGIKELLVTPKHFQVRAGGFLPPNFVVNVPFPRRGVTGHEIEIQWCWPTENAVTDCNNGLITERRHGSETFARILGGGCERPNGKNLALVANASWLSFVEPTLSANPGLTSIQT